MFQPIRRARTANRLERASIIPAVPDQAGEVIRQFGYTGFDFLSLIDEETPCTLIFRTSRAINTIRSVTRKGGAFAPARSSHRRLNARTRPQTDQRDMENTFGMDQVKLASEIAKISWFRYIQFWKRYCDVRVR